jgi:hypothetical protein
VNWVDLWGLADILIWNAIVRENNPNSILYYEFVGQNFSELQEAAAEMGLSVDIITGQEATNQNLVEKMNDTDPSRVIILAHGRDNGTVEDVNGNNLSFSDLPITSNTKIIDNVSCYADKAQWSLGNDTNSVDVRTYNPAGDVMWWNQTNDAINNRIPDSIRNGTDTSGPSTVSPAPPPYVPDNMFGFGSSSGNNGLDSGNNEVKKYK